MSKSNELPSKRQEEIVLPEIKANFTQISNEVLLDERLSFKARGILALLLSRPKNWKIYIDEIIERSDLDGKHSVRTGFKELKTFGYLELVKVWNDAGKFEGTIYKLCLNHQPDFPKTPNPPKILKTPKTLETATQKNLPPSKDFPTIEKTDLPKISTTENPSVDNSVRPKTMTPSNTKHSNTKHSNTKIQQQQTKAADDVSLKNSKYEKRFSEEVLYENVENKTAAPLLPFLEKDENWKKQFVGKDICKQVGTTEILTLPMLDLLLKHFTQTSISSGATYPNIAAIKRHFFNWFNANLNKNALSNYIRNQAVAPKKACKQVAALMPKTDAVLNKIYGQQCENEAHLYRCLQLLETHLATYENAVNILDTKNKTAVNTWIQDIEKTKDLVERGQKAGQLSWFYKRTTTLQSGVKNTSKGKYRPHDNQRTTTLQSGVK
jgi:hypothetical protein